MSLVVAPYSLRLSMAQRQLIRYRRCPRILWLENDHTMVYAEVAAWGAAGRDEVALRILSPKSSSRGVRERLS